MRISYSGIDLEVIHLVNFERTPVLSDDSVDYLFTKFTVSAVALVSSDQVIRAFRDDPEDTIGMSFRSAGGEALVAGGPRVIGIPAALRHTSNSSPIVTDTSIRHWLSVPRRRLLITDQNTAFPEVLLQSPKPGSAVDAHNGPFPEVYSVEQVMGDARLFMVSLQVTTYVSECEEHYGFAGAFLSNRFAQTHDVDEDGYITIKTEGEARFRTDLIYGQLNPDDLRPMLFLPIPNGFKRQNVIVSGMSDVSGMRYSFIDQQMHQQLVVGDEINATRVEAVYRQAILTNEDALGTVLNATHAVGNVALNKKWLEAKEGTPKRVPVAMPVKPPPILPKFKK